MGVHRLLQRAFARLYGYSLPPAQSARDEFMADMCSVPNMDDYTTAALSASSMADLHFKVKGARHLS